jgi:nicotinamide riboside kinase
MAFTIGIVGAPATGKSTLAEGISYALKKKNSRVELVNEYARNFVSKFGAATPSDQFHILLEQIGREKKIRESNSAMVTDSPYWLSLIYAMLCEFPDGDKESYYIGKIINEILPIQRSYNLIFYLPLSESFYSKVGKKVDDGFRIHLEYNLLKQIDSMIKGFMDCFRINYDIISSDDADERLKQAMEIVERNLEA